jgi:dihydroflavonol-4-reductase
MAFVCVTGGSGFIGSQVVRELAEAGHQVRATTRNALKAKEQLGALGAEWAEADLSKPESFDVAFEGCDYVIHTASPYRLTVADPQRDLVDPAVNGTVAVLEASHRSGSVKRVVLTSSFAAITDEPDGDFTEADWNTKSSLTRNPYYYSKTMAERAAWQFVGDHPGFDLVVVNPDYVIGPSLIREVNQTVRTLVGMVTGLFPAILDLDYPFVDVRDVAVAHRLAIETPAAQGRYICSAEVWSQKKLAEWIKRADLGLGPVPRWQMTNRFGTTLAKAIAQFQKPGERDYVRSNIGRHPRIDNSKIRRELGITFRPVEETLLETYRDLERWGHLPKS